MAQPIKLSCKQNNFARLFFISFSLLSRISLVVKFGDSTAIIYDNGYEYDFTIKITIPVIYKIKDIIINNKNNNVNVPNPLNTSEVENKTKKIASRINETNIIIIGIIILSKV